MKAEKQAKPADGTARGRIVLVGTYKGDQLADWPGWYCWPLDEASRRSAETQRNVSHEGTKATKESPRGAAEAQRPGEKKQPDLLAPDGARDDVSRVGGEPIRVLESVTELWLFQGTKEQRNYKAEFVGAKTREELVRHFTSVIDWIDGVFKGVKDEMCGLDWGRLYDAYHGRAYAPDAVLTRVEALFADEFVTDRRGVFEYVLGGETDTKLLNVRVFSDKGKKQVYAKQTAAAERKGVSNCPLCAVGHEANAKRIWKLAEMDADHVAAWSKGGATDIANCQMLCKTHNRAKGNR